MTKNITFINMLADSSDTAKNLYSYGRNDGTGHAHGHMSDDFTAPDTIYMFFLYIRRTSLSGDRPRQARYARKSGGVWGHCSIDTVSGCTYTSSDSGGGAVDMIFHGMPDHGSWVVQDDGDEFNGTSSPGAGWSTSATCHSSFEDNYSRVCFGWGGWNNDGGVRTGMGRDISDLRFVVESEWGSGASGWGRHSTSTLDHWKFLTVTESGALEEIDLDRSQNLTIEGAAPYWRVIGPFWPAHTSRARQRRTYIGSEVEQRSTDAVKPAARSQRVDRDRTRPLPG